MGAGASVVADTLATAELSFVDLSRLGSSLGPSKIKILESFPKALPAIFPTISLWERPPSATQLVRMIGQALPPVRSP